MMVEAGAKILPEAVMAEAIMFAHRALQPLIDLQEQLREEVGKPKRSPYIEPGDRVRRSTFVDGVEPGASSSSSTSRRPARTSRWPTSSRSAPSGSRAGKIADRWSTLVNPGRPIIGNQMHGITDEDVKKAPPSPQEAAQQLLDWAGDALLVGHNVGFDIGFLEAALGDGSVRAGPYFDTLVSPARPTRTSDLQAGRPVARSSARAGPEPPRAARRRGDGRAAAPARAGTCRAASTRCKSAIADSIRANRTGGDTPRPSLEAARREARFCKSLFGLLHKKIVRELVLNEGIRMDGRDLDRDPADHGRGRAPAARPRLRPVHPRRDAGADVATLGPSSDVQRIDTISPETEKRYIHHYNMPPYSTGENKPMRGPGRREIGHGDLAERALVPGAADATRSSRTSSASCRECVTSNGSTSMASTCGSTLALMDAGVPIKAPVAGAAMGLVTEPDGKFAVLTDILGKEDCVRRHGLQGHRHARRHHRPADGHQGQGHQRGDHPRRPREGPRGALASSTRCSRSCPRPAAR